METMLTLHTRMVDTDPSNEAEVLEVVNEAINHLITFFNVDAKKLELYNDGFIDGCINGLEDGRSGF